MKRVVIYRLGSLGDTVVALPCLNRVAERHADAERIMLTNIPVSAKAAPLEAILGRSAIVQRYIAYPLGTRSIRALAELRAELRALQADTLIYLTPSRGLRAAVRDWLFFKTCGFREIVGVPLTSDLQHNRIAADGIVERESARLTRCIEHAYGPVDLDDRAAWELHLTAAERATADAFLAPLGDAPRIAINMGGKAASNDWGEPNWLALAARLRATLADHALVFVGAAEDSARAQRLGATWPGPVLDLCGRVAPRVSAAAMAGARVFVGHDSGPLHLAADVGVPCVGLYGGTNAPCKWHPHGNAHRILHVMDGVGAIAVETVAQAVLEIAGRVRDAAPLRQVEEAAR